MSDFGYIDLEGSKKGIKRKLKALPKIYYYYYFVIKFI